MRSPVKYFGGKGLMINKIKDYFPNKDTYDTYIEPFSGSFSIGLTMDVPNLIYNDLDKNVYALYQVLSDRTLFDLFKFKCDITFYSEYLRQKFKAELKNENLSTIDRAFYFFYVNRTSHNGVGGFSVNSVIRRNMSKSVSDYLSAIDRLPELHNFLSKVIITNKDGIEVIKKYNKPNVLIYCDPPYEQSTRTSTRYAVDMNREQHLKFIETIKDSKAKVIVSGYDCDIYKELEDAGWEKINFTVNTVDGKRNPKTKVETLWRNYK